jgi:hypothetical protein
LPWAIVLSPSVVGDCSPVIGILVTLEGRPG